MTDSQGKDKKYKVKPEPLDSKGESLLEGASQVDSQNPAEYVAGPDVGGAGVKKGEKKVKRARSKKKVVSDVVPEEVPSKSASAIDSVTDFVSDKEIARSSVVSSAFEGGFIGDAEVGIDIDYIISRIAKPAKNVAPDRPVKLPVLCLKDVVCFPNSIVPLYVGRPHSIESVDKAVASNSAVFLVTEKNSAVDEVDLENVFSIGCIGRVIQKIKLPNETLRVLIDVQCRAKVLHYFYKSGDKLIEALVEVEKNVAVSEIRLEALKRSLVDALTKYAALSKKINANMVSSLFEIYDIDAMSDIIMNKVPFGVKKKQEVLEISDMGTRLEKILAMLLREIDVLEAEVLIQTNVKAQVEKNQKEYYLHEQIKAIRKELGDGDGAIVAAEKYEKELQMRVFPDAVKQKIQEEIKRLRSSNSMSTETIISYLDWLVFLPWGKVSEKVDVDILEAAKILENTHYGLDRVKASILEYIVAQNVNPRGTVLCLYGPPGIGKTSIVKSIAKAMGREYGKISLGGVRDEAEIRGHRKTYVSAMPGRIIQTIKRLGVDNPVILLDEIDKMAHDQRGDPESAMLEVLDPEQNHSFQDHYLGLEYDLSKVIFVSTANSLDMQRPLLDRLDIVDVSSYLEFEKREICKNYIIPRVLKEHGLVDGSICFEDDAIDEVIRYYTREAGVRSADRVIKRIVRKCLVKFMFAKGGAIDEVKDQKWLLDSGVAVDVSELDYIKKMKDIPMTEDFGIVVTRDSVKGMVGPRVYSDSDVFKADLVGVTHGLGYSDVGGSVLLVEAIKSAGKGEVKITGKLGDVMKESFQAALSYIKHRLSDWNVNGEDLKNFDIHIHVPAGAVAKDGPSAGVTICTTIASLLLNIPVKSSVAMTGEISLRGKVLAIGGLREKMVAAIRGGIKTVLIPKDNLKDLEEMPSYIINAIEILPCEFVDEVLDYALSRKIEKREHAVNISVTKEMGSGVLFS